MNFSLFVFTIVNYCSVYGCSTKFCSPQSRSIPINIISISINYFIAFKWSPLGQIYVSSLGTKFLLCKANTVNADLAKNCFNFGGVHIFMCWCWCVLTCHCFDVSVHYGVTVCQCVDGLVLDCGGMLFQLLVLLHCYK